MHYYRNSKKCIIIKMLKMHYCRNGYKCIIIEMLTNALL